MQATDELGRVTQYTTDDLGRITAITDPAGDTTNFSYDALDRLLTSTNSLNHVTEYAYDAADRLLRVTAPNGAQETYQYDGYGRQTSMTRYNGGVSLMTYRSDNLPATQTNPAGTVTQFQYDQSKRLIQTNTGGLQTTYNYDSRGLLTSAVNEDASISRTYDAFGRLISEQTNGRTVAYGYSLHDDLASLNANGDTRSYSYDNRGLLATINSHLGSFTHSWDALGRLNGNNYPNAMALTHSYDAASQLSARSYTGSYSKQWSYSQNSKGLITGISEDSSAQSYGYDAIGRLTGANTLAGTYSYSYDSMGNRTEAGQTYNSATEIQSANGESFEHDANGNMIKRTLTADGSYTTYSYNARERLIQTQHFADANAATPDWTVSYQYDAFGRRVGLITNGVTKTFLWSGSTLLTEYVNGAIDRDYVSGAGYAPLAVNDGATTQYLISDHLGAPQAAVNSAGAETWSRLRSPYGIIQTETGSRATPIGFPGQYWDEETGLHYNFFRDYDSTTGRYLQRDPIGLNGGVNTDAYVFSNPLRYIDPLGLDVTICLYPGNPSHVGIGVNSDNTIGRRTNGKKIPFPGRDVPGRVSEDSGEKSCSTTKATKEQDEAVQDYIDRNIDNPGNYNLTSRSCVDFVRDVMRDQLNMNLNDTNLPTSLYNQIRVQNGERRQTRRGLR